MNERASLFVFLFVAAREWRLTVGAVVEGEKRLRHLNMLSSP